MDLYSSVNVCRYVPEITSSQSAACGHKMKARNMWQCCMCLLYCSIQNLNTAATQRSPNHCGDSNCGKLTSLLETREIRKAESFKLTKHNKMAEGHMGATW